MTDLIAERRFEWRATADPGDGLTLEGYAAVFDQWTQIDDWDGTYLESIARGAFRKTLRERKDRVVLQYDHGHHPLIGSLPIGQIDALREDDHGLHVKARLHENWLTQPLRDAITSGSISGMSFRFRPIAHREEPAKGKTLPKRTITEVALYELGPVAFPAYEGTSVGLRAWANAAPAEFRSALLVGEEGPELVVPMVLPAGQTKSTLTFAIPDTMTNERTLTPAGTTTGDEDRAAAEDEPAKATRQERRQMATLLCGVTDGIPPRAAA